MANYRMTDLGNAERMAADYKTVLRFCHEQNTWLLWDGSRWARDTTGEIILYGADTVRAIYVDAIRERDKAKRQELVKHAIKSEGEPRMRAMISLAKSQPGIPVQPAELDFDPSLLNVENGTINLKTGKLQPHRQEDLITKIAPVEYDPEAKCPLFDKFLDRMMGENEDLKRFLQKAVGYSLTGDTSEQCLFMLHGAGQNGKSTFIETIRALQGDYARQTEFATFLANDRGNDRVRNDLARLDGARFVSAVEAEPGQRLSEVVVKQITGSDKIAARFLYQEFFEFVPQFKLFLATNHKPDIRGTDLAIWRRVRLIPFAVTIPENERDNHLLDRLKAELPGILNWALDGCLDWQEDGLRVPREVEVATSEYREEMDPIASFIEEHCVLGPDNQNSAAILYKSYMGWCDEEGERPITKKAFGMRLSERGFEQIRINTTEGQVRGWKGLSLPMVPMI